MLRIGLSGTNWTRKTTTIQQVAAALSPTPVEIVSLSSLVQQCPFPMGPAQTLDGSKWMVDQVTSILARPVPVGTIQVFDRTPLDILAFTLYAAERTAGLPASCAAESAAGVSDTILSLAVHFMLIFVCRPGGEWPAPETPPSDMLAFAKKMDSFMSLAAGYWKSQLCELSWDAGQRREQILARLQHKA